MTSCYSKGHRILKFKSPEFDSCSSKEAWELPAAIAN